MLAKHILAGLGWTTAQIATASPVRDLSLPAHTISRQPAGYRFENLAIRPDGQILTTTASPGANIFQIDPLGILPPTLVYEVPLVNGSAAGINEGERDVYYVVAGMFDILNTSVTHPDTYQIVELDMRDVRVLPNGTLNRKPLTKRVANLTDAQLPNGATFARPESSHLLVADSYRGLIWNVNAHTGQVAVALNDTSTKGGPPGSPAYTGVNGIKEHNGSIYWTVTGLSQLWRIEIDECGNVPQGCRPTLIASNITCDDLVIDQHGNAFVAGPKSVITRVSPDGEQTIMTGTLGSSNSSVVGPTALRFGRMASDRWSLYITTNGGLPQVIGESVPSAAGVSRMDLSLIEW